MVLRRASLRIRVGGVRVVWLLGRARREQDGRQRRRSVALEVHVHAKSNGGLERACVYGRVCDIAVMHHAPYATALPHGRVCVQSRPPRRARRDVRNGRILGRPELAGCDPPSLSEQVAPSVAQGAAVRLRLRRGRIVVFVRRAVEILQRYRLVRLAPLLVVVVVGVGVRHGS